jgi:hypothetical protein
VDDTIRGSIKTNTSRGRTQPYMIVVGPLEQPIGYYTVIENHKYLFQSIFSAFDACFKSFWVFNLEYPIESARFWFIVQHFCYKIALQTDQIEKITDLKSKIEAKIAT